MTKVHTPNGLIAGYSNRYDLNLGINVGDTLENALNNQNTFAQKLGIGEYAYLQQEHGSQVVIAQNGGFYGAGDALLTQKVGLGLLICVADCNALLLYDTKQKVLSAIHAGRMGIAKGIVRNALEKMRRDFNANPSDIWVYIAPSIRSCCYEVGEDVFCDSTLKKEQQKELERGKLLRDGKVYLDLLKILQMQLLNEGLDLKNIIINGSCTACNGEFFSYRRDGNVGRFGLMCALC